ncbi:hypothetical protein HDU91_000570 [Kappamyces sp. JEL0680]|nr:hypothetical protein HDU91_000570 [Kappamyces sp. JEL0680]
MSLYRNLLSFVFLLVAWGAFQLIVNHEVLRTPTVETLSVQPGTITFTAYQGEYSQITSFMNGVKQDLAAFYRSRNQTYQAEQSSVKLFGIYYDDPHKLVDSSLGRAVVGVLVHDQDNHDLVFDPQAFIAASSTPYKVASLPALTMYGTRMPLHTVVNLLVAVVRSYPILTEYAKANGLADAAQCSFELYDYPAKTMVIGFPHGKGSEQLLGLSGFAQPAYKAG